MFLALHDVDELLVGIDLAIGDVGVRHRLEELLSAFDLGVLNLP
jgi:hypothetical protein